MENKQLDATVKLFIRNMKVTRNLDDDSEQDPFFTLYNFKMSKVEWDKVQDKYKHDLHSKPISKQKSKVI